MSEINSTRTIVLIRSSYGITFVAEYRDDFGKDSEYTVLTEPLTVQLIPLPLEAQTANAIRAIDKEIEKAQEKVLELIDKKNSLIALPYYIGESSS